MSFITSKKVLRAFVGENTKGARGKVYKFHTSVITFHIFDQVHVFFFFAPCLVSKLDLKPTLSSRIYRHFECIRK